jgi:hypothetical protein
MRTNAWICTAGMWLTMATLTGDAVAQERHWGRFHSVHLDQDLFAPRNEDRNYTMGLRFAWSGNDARHHTFNTFNALRRMDAIFGLSHDVDTERIGHAVAFGNSAFTPDELRARRPISDDRPYASLLYASSSVVVVDEGDEGAAQGSKLVVGVLGLSISEWVQTKIHVINRSISGDDTPYDPKGWGSQISDGGELTAMYQRSWLVRVPVRSPWLDGAASCDASVGYYTGASCGLVGRWGKLEKTNAFWTMLEDVNPQADSNMLLSRANDARDLAGTHGPGTPLLREWYVLAGVRARFVGYNELLQGGFRESAHTLGQGEIERWVHEISLGLNLTFDRSRRWMFMCTRRSAEHRLAQRRAHQWCGINYYRPLR